MREFHELKPYVNILYRHVVDSWQYWSEQPLQVYNSIRTPLGLSTTHNRILIIVRMTRIARTGITLKAIVTF
mgnify:CR=1 FL=1